MSKLPTAPKGWRECTKEEFYKAWRKSKCRGMFKSEGDLSTKHYIPIEPITASGEVGMGDMPYDIKVENIVASLGLKWHQVAGKKFKVTMEEVIE